MVLLNFNFHGTIQLPFYAIRPDSMNFGDVESFITC